MSKNLCPDAIHFANELKEEMPDVVDWLNGLSKKRSYKRNKSSAQFTAVVNAVIK